MTIESTLVALQSAETALAQVVAAPDSVLFNVSRENHSMTVTVRPQVQDALSDERMIQLLLAEAKNAIDALTVDSIRDALRVKIKQYIWDTANAAQPSTDANKMAIDDIITQYTGDPDINTGV